jgi:cytochrome c-type biogenesis protein CcmE
MNRTRRKLLIAVAVFILAGGYLAYSGARSSFAYYMTVSELHDRAPRRRSSLGVRSSSRKASDRSTTTTSPARV